MQHTLIKRLVQSILENPLKYEWTIQGFGMLRMYLPGSENIRMHIWDSRYRVPDVSDIHTHPWNFESYVVVGEVVNYRYHENKSTREGVLGPGNRHWKQDIHCGTGGCVVGKPQLTVLGQGVINQVIEGQTYHQNYKEIHKSVPQDGTITLVKRTVQSGQSVDMAHVFWRENEQWVTAEPKPADWNTVTDITQHSLNRWFR